MVHAFLLSLMLAQPAPAPAPAPSPQPAAAAHTGAEDLWLVEPLYPGQEILVGRTESAIAKLLPPGARDRVGFAALQDLVAKGHGDLACALGEKPCKDPVDQYLRGLGLAKLVLIKGGQEEPDYTYQVTSIDLATGEAHAAQGHGPVLEKALLAALVKVAPLASALTVTSKPAGLALYIDGEKVGRTPFEGQILPGERTLELRGDGYQTLKKTLTVSARGKVALDETLSLSPSTLVIKPVQKKAIISVDGKPQGQGDVTLQIAPGSHLVEATLEGYEPYKQAITVAASGQTQAAPDLSPTAASDVLGRSYYLEVGYQQEVLRRRKGAYRVNAFPLNKDDAPNKANPSVGGLNAGTTLRGVTVDWGQQHNHFGLLLLGFTYFASSHQADRVYPDAETGTFNNLALHQARGTYGDFYDLHFIQPQASYVLWHFMGYVQAGLGVRALRIDTSDFTTDSIKHGDGYLDIAPYGMIKVGLRGYLYEGFYLHASYRFTYVLSINARSGLTPLSPTDGFAAGLGYAF